MTHAPPGFVTTRVDQWGNAFVLCPVCGDEFKADGIKKHMLLQCRAEQKIASLECKGHCVWIDKHPVPV